MPKSTRTTTASLREEFGRGDFECPRERTAASVEGQIHWELSMRRLLRVSSFDWHSEATGGPIPWNGTELIIRALNSAHGILLIGGTSQSVDRRLPGQTRCKKS